MPIFASQSRDELRRTYFDAWRKYREQLPLSPLEAQIADVIGLHPEYHSVFADSEKMLDKDWRPEGGASNPFLHMGLHLAIRDQVLTNRPSGIQVAYQALLMQMGDAHEVEHRMIECLAEALWQAQRNNLPPNETEYLEQIKRLSATAT